MKHEKLDKSSIPRDLIIKTFFWKIFTKAATAGNDLCEIGLKAKYLSKCAIVNKRLSSKRSDNACHLSV